MIDFFLGVFWDYLANALFTMFLSGFLIGGFYLLCQWHESWWQRKQKRLRALDLLSSCTDEQLLKWYELKENYKGENDGGQPVEC